MGLIEYEFIMQHQLPKIKKKKELTISLWRYKYYFNINLTIVLGKEDANEEDR